MDGKCMRGEINGATVAVSLQGMEALMVGKERWEEIRRWRASSESISAIARQLDLDRKTVRTCLKQPEWAPYRRAASMVTLLSPHWDWLKARAPQMCYSARILYQELMAQRGFLGGYDTVKLAVRPLRVDATLASLTQRRFETEPGQQAQVDWGRARRNCIFS